LLARRYAKAYTIPVKLVSSRRQISSAILSYQIEVLVGMKTLLAEIKKLLAEMKKLIEIKKLLGEGFLC
jgi:hypothetical protein